MSVSLEITLLGTGTSSTLPALACLTDPHHGCVCCRSTMRNSDRPSPNSWKNIRRNTSALIRVKRRDQKDRTILIDCGKSFYTSALQHFPAKGFREIDAVLLTHSHADAVNGLDDLRSWTLHGTIQKRQEIYCDQPTFDHVSRAFPYLTNKKEVTGGGDVPEIEWHIIDSSQPFEVCGVTVNPFIVHHGFKFGGEPFHCLAYLFQQEILYCSDAHLIPEEAFQLIENVMQKKKLPILIVDTLKIAPHWSHFGIGQTMAAIERIQPLRTYILGFAHRITHQMWLNACLALSEIKYKRRTQAPAWARGHEQSLACERYLQTKVQEDFDMFTQACIQETSGWVVESETEGKAYWIRPGYDGLTIGFDEQINQVYDSTTEDEMQHNQI